MSEGNYQQPERGTVEFHLKMLKKLQKWLAINPKNLQLNEDEANAVQWAIDQLEKEKN